ncbi:MAG: hypothetical protein AB8G77_07930 [Rhodothermales bacterium]
MKITPVCTGPRRIESIGLVFLCLSCLFLIAPRLGFSQWDTVKKDGCVSWGTRQYSARLLTNPKNHWQTSCEQSPAAIKGMRRNANRCDNHGWGGMWGIWFVEDDFCVASWGTPSNSCTQQDLRTYSAQLYNIPDRDWKGACAKSSLTVGGKDFSTPTRCKDLGARGMWGEFDVVDTSCRARWGSWADKGCAGEMRRYEARLENTQTNDWENECMNTAPVINGVSYDKPDNCHTRGTFAMYGTWGSILVKDDVCSSSYDPDYIRRVNECIEGIDISLREFVKSCVWGEPCVQAVVVSVWSLICRAQ